MNVKAGVHKLWTEPAQGQDRSFQREAALLFREAVPLLPGLGLHLFAECFRGGFPWGLKRPCFWKAYFLPHRLFSGTPRCPLSLSRSAVAFSTASFPQSPALPVRLAPTPPGSLLPSAEASSGSPPGALHDSVPSPTHPHTAPSCSPHRWIFLRLLWSHLRKTF